jgi:phage recombination protein Bet
VSDLIRTENEITFSSDQVDLIKSQIAKGCSDDELKLFMHVASKSGLDPFSRQIYAIKRKAKVDGEYREVMSIQTGIDGFRLIAHRTGKCLSISDATFTFGTDKVIPESATVTVKKLVGSHIGEFTATAYWSDYYGDGKSYMANSKPRLMLSKVCESLAIRKAFPLELSGIYTQEEMIQADLEEIKIEFISFLRSEIKFNDVDSLKNQIAKDVEFVRGS